jgi:hypothetical protein
VNETVVVKDYINGLGIQNNIHMDNLYKHVEDFYEFYIYLK